jgi:hypothetical protein
LNLSTHCIEVLIPLDARVIKWVRTCNVTPYRNAVTLQVTDTIRGYDLNFHPVPHGVTVSCERYTVGFRVCYGSQKWRGADGGDVTVQLVSKGKVQSRTGHEGREGGLKYSSILSLTSAIDGVSGQRQAPAALPHGKKPSTNFIGGWVGPRAGVDVCGKFRPPPGFYHRTVQPVASRYTD